MNGPQCEYCQHLNPDGAEVCEACHFPLGGDPTAGWADPRPAEPGPGGAWSPADDIPAPPFKGVGDVVSPMLAVYRKHFTLVGILVLVAMIPEALLHFGFISLVQGRALLAEAAVGGSGGVAATGGGSSLALFAVASGLVIGLLGMVCGALLSASLVYAVVDLQRAGRSSAGECLARGLKSLPKVLLVTVLSRLATLAGLLLLVVPGIILSLALSVGIPVAVVERRGPIDSLTRSYALTKGYKGLIFVTYFLWGLLVLALDWIVAWSFSSGGGSRLDLLPMMLVQTAVTGMLNSSTHVLTVFIYLGLLREHRSPFSTHAFTPA